MKWQPAVGGVLPLPLVGGQTAAAAAALVKNHEGLIPSQVYSGQCIEDVWLFPLGLFLDHCQQPCCLSPCLGGS